MMWDPILKPLLLYSSLSELHGNDQSFSFVSEGESNVPVEPAPEESITQSSAAEKVRGVKIVGDNIDKTVHTRFMRVDKQGSSLHYFHAYATQDRFDLTMPEDVPVIPDDPKLFKDILPSDSDKATLKEFFCDSRCTHFVQVLCLPSQKTSVMSFPSILIIQCPHQWVGNPKWLVLQYLSANPYFYTCLHDLSIWGPYCIILSVIAYEILISTL